MKTILTAILLLRLSSFGFSQTDPLRNQLNSVFANVDKSQIPGPVLDAFHFWITLIIYANMK
jgi:hypothetical protein